MKQFDFNGLFIFDIANNHQGDLEHGLNIIRAIGDVSRHANIKGALKFQFRQIDTFIHPDYKDKKDIPHIPRFVSTALTKDDYRILTNEVRRQEMMTIATPFDEGSVDMLLDLDIEIIKIGSCSADDWPLLKKVSETGRPIIISIAALSMSKIDKLVSLFEHKKANFALMHCIALYPTPYDKLCLNQIELLKNRFPNITIGFSTHEAPENYKAIQIAFAKGARIFERHVGLETGKYKLNAYSSTPEQIAQWITSYHEAVDTCGGEERMPPYIEEIHSLNSLKRGVFAKKDIKKGEIIKHDHVFFAMPVLDGQLISGEWRENIVADKDYSAKEPLGRCLANYEVSEKDLIYQIMLQVKGILNNARIFIGKDSTVEISHHYGLERFREFGVVIINCINQDYCKKLIVQLPRQKHPVHYHKKKEETFQLLYGDVEIVLDGYKHRLNLGDTLLVKPKQWHKFHTLDGMVMEEVSTRQYDDDSFYEDEKIALLPRERRKTKILNWESSVEKND